MSGILPWQSHELVISISSLESHHNSMQAKFVNAFTLLILMMMVTGQAVASC
jgi:hypothetical protein